MPIEFAVRKSNFDSKKKNKISDRIGSVIEYVNTLVDEGYWNYDELPLIARNVYFTDYLLAQVENGGFEQFFYSSGGQFDKEVSRGLEKIGAARYAIVFAVACKAVRTDSPKTGAALEKLGDKLLAFEKKTSLSKLAFDYLEKQRSKIEVLADREYKAFLTALTTKHSGFKKRKQRCKAELAQMEHDAEVFANWERICDFFCRKHRYKFSGISAVADIKVKGKKFPAIFFTGGNKADPLRLFAAYEHTGRYKIVDGDTLEEVAQLEIA